MRQLREIQGSPAAGEGHILVDLVYLSTLGCVSPFRADDGSGSAAREDDKVILAGIRQVGSPRYVHSKQHEACFPSRYSVSGRGSWISGGSVGWSRVLMLRCVCISTAP
jgi:hypothetical protein